MKEFNNVVMFICFYEYYFDNRSFDRGQHGIAAHNIQPISANNIIVTLI